ncbi:MAG: phage portal protein [Pyrinomonadaceae bacterium]
MNQDIEQALVRIRDGSARYEKAGRYYDGDHDLAFATEKFQNTFGTLFREFALNLCPVICDALKDKLRITGFGVDDAGTQAPLPASGREDAGGREQRFMLNNARRRYAGGTGVAGRGACVPAGDLNSATRRIWQRNRMGTRAGEIHKEAHKTGDAYAIVWPNELGEAVIYANRAANITVVYDDDAPGRIAWAAKVWRLADKHVRLNLMYPDRIEKYISKRESEGALPEWKEFVPAGTRAPAGAPAAASASGVALPARRDSGSRRPAIEGVTPEEPAWQARVPAFPTASAFPAVVPNPYGVVPVFHFANNADLGTGGRSELEVAMPIQDGLNKSVLDMLVAMEFSAYRQRWAAGIEIEYDQEGKAVAPFTAGIDHLWIAENPNARFGDFDAAQLEQFLKVKDSFRIDMASVTGTPLHYFLQQSGEIASGESLKRSETRFLAKVRDRQESFGQTWADAMSLALMIEGHGRDVSLITEWEEAAPMSEREVLENILLKRQIGLPVDQALIEAGYGAADVAAMTQPGTQAPLPA